MSNRTICYYIDTSPFEQSELFDRGIALIPWQQRIDNINRLRRQKDKRLSLGAGLLLSYALKRAGAQSLELIYGEHGKPRLADGSSKLSFNCSHSGEIAVVAVSKDNVGVDVERLGEFKPAVAKRFFREDELSYMGQSIERFYQLWTRKESYLKYLGTGLGISPKSFSVLDTSTLEGGCHFCDYQLDGYSLSVCTTMPAELIKLDTSELLNYN